MTLPDGSLAIADGPERGQVRTHTRFKHDDGEFGSCVWYTREHRGWTEVVLRVSGSVYTDEVKCDGPLIFRKLVVSDAPACQSITKWAYQNTSSTSGLAVVQPKDDGGNHEIPAGNVRTFHFAVGMLDEDKTVCFSRPQDKPIRHSLFGISANGVSEVMGPFGYDRVLVLANDARNGIGMDAWVPYGLPAGDDPGGFGVQITPWEEIDGSWEANEYCWLMALRQDCRTDTWAVSSVDGMPLNPHDFPSMFAFDSGAGTSDASRIPHFNHWDPKPWNTGESPPATALLKKWHQHNDEHYSRALWGLTGLLEHLPDESPIRMWALETLYARACYLWLEIPDIPAKGANLPGLIRMTQEGTIRKGWWDRDEGLTLWTAMLLEHYCFSAATRSPTLASQLISRERMARVRTWHRSWRTALSAAILPNGIPQSVGKGEKSWSSDPWKPDEDGNVLADTDRAAYSFQVAIILTAAHFSDVVCEADAFGDAVAKGAGFLYRHWVPSGKYDVNGGKVGPANIVAVEGEGRRLWGGGEITNCLALWAITGMDGAAHDALGDGALDPDRALAIIKSDTLQGYSASLKWSGLLMQRILDGKYDPLGMNAEDPAPDPEPDPVPDNSTDPQDIIKRIETQRDRALNEARILSAENARRKEEIERLELLLQEIHNLSE